MEYVKAGLASLDGVDPRVEQRSQAFSGMNDGPAATAARIAGIVQKDTMKDDSPYYTSNFGQVIPDAQHCYNVGGIPYQGDALLLEKQQAFDRSKLQERIVHPCGSSAFGYFKVTHDISDLTKADFLQEGKKTPLNTRFSTVTYGREYPDQARNPRGLAVKFYTSEGNFDLVGLNWPVFFVRDPFMGPDNIRSQQRKPRSFLLDYNGWFDFASQVPESIHAMTMLCSDYGTPQGWIHMSGYGIHTFRMVNKAGEANYVKFHWRCHQGSKQYTMEETVQACGLDPDFSKRQLFDLIEEGSEVKWTMLLQTMTPQQATEVDFDPFDPTKVWPRTQFKMREVGTMVLNRNPEDYHRDVDQACFSPGSLVPGIELSPDPLLQWRAFFYRDAQFHRMGSANIHQIPVNCPFMAKFHSPDNYDGVMRSDANSGGKPKYFPNSYHSAQPKANTTPSFGGSYYAESAYQTADNVVSRRGHWRSEGTTKEYDQVRELYKRVMRADQRGNLHKNTAHLLKFADPLVQRNYLIQLYAVDPEYAEGVYGLLTTKSKVDFDEVRKLSKTAHLVGKDPHFMMKDPGASIMGLPIRGQFETGFRAFDNSGVPNLHADSVTAQAGTGGSG